MGPQPPVKDYCEYCGKKEQSLFEPEPNYSENREVWHAWYDKRDIVRVNTWKWVKKSLCKDCAVPAKEREETRHISNHSPDCQCLNNK